MRSLPWLLLVLCPVLAGCSLLNALHHGQSNSSAVPANYVEPAARAAERARDPLEPSILNQLAGGFITSGTSGCINLDAVSHGRSFPKTPRDFIGSDVCYWWPCADDEPWPLYQMDAQPASTGNLWGLKPGQPALVQSTLDSPGSLHPDRMIVSAVPLAGSPKGQAGTIATGSAVCSFGNQPFEMAKFKSMSSTEQKAVYVLYPWVEVYNQLATRVTILPNLPTLIRDGNIALIGESWGMPTRLHVSVIRGYDIPAPPPTEWNKATNAFVLTVVIDGKEFAPFGDPPTDAVPAWELDIENTDLSWVLRDEIPIITSPLPPEQTPS
ncbi:MAG: hypothetical protein ABI743_06630 [bacterium]